jgi:hypothetical protein
VHLKAQSSASYFSFVMGALALVLAANAYLVYAFNQVPTDKEIEADIEERERKKKKKEDERDD